MRRLWVKLVGNISSPLERGGEKEEVSTITTLKPKATPMFVEV
jgi:hypothetical protein